MANKSRPRDSNQLAKMIVDISTGDELDEISDKKKNPESVKGRQGGIKGGKVRAEKLSDEERADIARIAATARWKKTESKEKG